MPRSGHHAPRGLPAGAEAYDKLVAETIEAIKTGEPGTLVYASHTVEGQPLSPGT